MERKTYKEKILVKETPEEIIEIMKAISLAKDKAISTSYVNREQIATIPNAGEYANSKLNDFVSQLEQKSIQDESVLYSILKNFLCHNVINYNLHDLEHYEKEYERKLENNKPNNTSLQIVKKATMFEKIKRLIMKIMFRVHYITDSERESEIERANNYIKMREETKEEHRAEIAGNVEQIADLELNEELLIQSIQVFFESIKDQKDFDIQIFKNELAEELEKMGMQSVIKNIFQLLNENTNLANRIKVDISSNVVPQQNLNQQQVNTIAEEEQYK